MLTSKSSSKVTRTIHYQSGIFADTLTIETTNVDSIIQIYTPSSIKLITKLKKVLNEIIFIKNYQYIIIIFSLNWITSKVEKQNLS